MSSSAHNTHTMDTLAFGMWQSCTKLVNSLLYIVYFAINAAYSMTKTKKFLWYVNGYKYKEARRNARRSVALTQEKTIQELVSELQSTTGEKNVYRVAKQIAKSKQVTMM